MTTDSTTDSTTGAPPTGAPASAALLARARAVTPGGVNSPVRAFRGVGGTPRFIASARGAQMTDVEGRTYIDYVGSWGPMILGHAAPEVIDASAESYSRGCRLHSQNRWRSLRFSASKNNDCR